MLSGCIFSPALTAVADLQLEIPGSDPVWQELQLQQLNMAIAAIDKASEEAKTAQANCQKSIDNALGNKDDLNWTKSVLTAISGHNKERRRAFEGLMLAVDKADKLAKHALPVMEARLAEIKK